MGPTTAFTHQVNEMLQEELDQARGYQQDGTSIPYSNRSSLDPRERILKDLQQVILSEREQGFHPILLMVANEDRSADNGEDLWNFMTATISLVDPLSHKFGHDGITATTYARGKRRIDFILMDEKPTSAIQCVGTLGLHEAMVSDHVMLYVELDERKLFNGIINRPVAVASGNSY